MSADHRVSLRIAIPLLTAACLFAVLQQPGRAQEPGASDPKMNACAAHLASIGKAVAAFEKDHGKLPDFLSDLHPRYVPDKKLFHCPADPSPEGSPGRRWVIYAGSNDGSRVPPGWQAWLRGTIDALPEQGLPPRRRWEKEPVPNLTGSDEAWVPSGSLRAEGVRAATTGDYSAWTPDEA